MKINYERSFWALLIFLINVIIFMSIISYVKNKAVEHIEQQNGRLKVANDSLEVLLNKNNKEIRTRDSLIVILTEKKVKIKYVYNEKIKRIEYLSDSQLCRLFDSIFSKNNVGQ
jgi:hypothetical protein